MASVEAAIRDGRSTDGQFGPLLPQRFGSSAHLVTSPLEDRRADGRGQRFSRKHRASMHFTFDIVCCSPCGEMGPVRAALPQEGALETIFRASSKSIGMASSPSATLRLRRSRVITPGF